MWVAHIWPSGGRHGGSHWHSTVCNGIDFRNFDHVGVIAVDPMGTDPNFIGTGKPLPGHAGIEIEAVVVAAPDTSRSPHNQGGIRRTLHLHAEVVKGLGQLHPVIGLLIHKTQTGAGIRGRSPGQLGGGYLPSADAPDECGGKGWAEADVLKNAAAAGDHNLLGLGGEGEEQGQGGEPERGLWHGLGCGVWGVGCRSLVFGNAGELGCGLGGDRYGFLQAHAVLLLFMEEEPGLHQIRALQRTC